MVIDSLLDVTGGTSKRTCLWVQGTVEETGLPHSFPAMSMPLNVFGGIHSPLGQRGAKTRVYQGQYAWDPRERVNPRRRFGTSHCDKQNRSANVWADDADGG